MKSEQEKIEEIIAESENSICWQAVPIMYDNYPKETTDKYEGDIFGRLSLFESPHFLFRRFHKNYCKAIALTKFKSYAFKKDEGDSFLDEVKKSININFDVRKLMMHNAIVLLVCSFESYLKDNFIYIITGYFPEKLKGKKPEEVARKFNFQNMASIHKAFKFLLSNYEDAEFYQVPHPKTFYPYVDCKHIICDLLILRHKIIHESFYDVELRENEFNWFFYSCLCVVEHFDSYFETNGFYKLKV